MAGDDASDARIHDVLSSVGADASGLHHLGPRRDFFFDEGGKFLWRAADFVRADTGDTLLYVGDLKRALDFPVSSADDSGRRAGGNNEVLVSCSNAILMNFLILSKNL